MSEQWVAARIKQKEDSKCIHSKNLRDLILAHLNMKRVDVFALSIYGLVIFPKALGHVDEAVSDLFDQLNKRVTPVPTIFAKTFRSLNACRRAGEGRFIGCAQLLLAWFHSHFWKVENVSYQVFSENYSQLKELVATPRRDDISEEKWIVLLLGIWGAIGFAPLLVLRQYRSRQFIPATQGPMTTSEYDWWWGKKVNDNIPVLSQEITRPIEKYLQVISSELEIIKQDFEKKSLELGRKIEQLEEEKMRLRLDVNIQKLEAEKLRKGENKAEEDLDSLKIEYKKLRLSIRTAAGLRARVAELEKSFQQYRSHNSAIKLRASLSKIEELKGKIGELDATLQNCELRVEFLEKNNEQWKEQFQRSSGQVRGRDYIMGEAVAQIREVADHLQTLAVQADILSIKYESESDRGRELAWLLRKVKALSVRAKLYI
ncbi:hypothetical protein Gogos_012331 [Gossypium gossypioides]|uniref:DUF7745 domain-containing protein n=1 Tax=Gossypium gossypioides TaxID=34282 RepID=A0A7J9BS60_GOSGO|nr:hypothetical protein [Gossypium gossypioides]